MIFKDNGRYYVARCDSENEMINQTKGRKNAGHERVFLGQGVEVWEDACKFDGKTTEEISENDIVNVLLGI